MKTVHPGNELDVIDRAGDNRSSPQQVEVTWRRTEHVKLASKPSLSTTFVNVTDYGSGSNGCRLLSFIDARSGFVGDNPSKLCWLPCVRDGKVYQVGERVRRRSLRMARAGWFMNLSVGSTPVAASSYFSVWHPRHTLKWCLASSAKLAGIYRVYRATHSCILQMNGRVSSPPGRTALLALRWRQPWRNTAADLGSPTAFDLTPVKAGSTWGEIHLGSISGIWRAAGCPDKAFMKRSCWRETHGHADMADRNCHHTCALDRWIDFVTVSIGLSDRCRVLSKQRLNGKIVTFFYASLDGPAGKSDVNINRLLDEPLRSLVCQTCEERENDVTSRLISQPPVQASGRVGGLHRRLLVSPYACCGPVSTVHVMACSTKASTSSVSVINCRIHHFIFAFFIQDN
ncbi:hypothetical protein Bbelb_207920 [Branchiostoma belcheri]|nr:hypothetical protein Bbelb_207920 [Branchiostoma belcheri]